MTALALPHLPHASVPLDRPHSVVFSRVGHLPLRVGVHPMRRTICVLGVRSAEEQPLHPGEVEPQLRAACEGHWTPYRIEFLEVLSAVGLRHPREQMPVMPGREGALQGYFNREGLLPDDPKRCTKLDDQLRLMSLPEWDGSGMRLSVQLNVSDLRAGPDGPVYDRSRMEATDQAVWAEWAHMSSRKPQWGMTFEEARGELPRALSRIRHLTEALLARHA